MRLQDRIDRYLSFLPGNAAQITISQLLCHTSGLSDQWVLLNLAGWSDRNIVRTTDINRLLRSQSKLKSSPGSNFSYTNTGYTLLAQIVEAVAGQSLDAYLRSTLFSSTAMSRTRFRSELNTRFDFEAECYSRGTDGRWTKTTPRFATVGATSLQTSLTDLGRWALRLSDPADLASGLMQHKGTLSNRQPVPYGFGLYHGTFGKMVTLSHSGWDADFSAHFVYLPESKVGAAVMSNGTQMNLELIAMSMLSEHVSLGKEAADISVRLSKAIKGLTVSSRGSDLRSHQRVYGSLASGDIRVWEQDAKGQRLKHGAIQDAESLGDGSFMLVASLSTIEFTHDALLISSPTQDVHQTLTLMPPTTIQLVVDGESSFYSKELNVSHTLIGKDGHLFWSRPGHASCLLKEIGPGLFFAGGFTLIASNENLIILNARSAPILFERVQS